MFNYKKLDENTRRKIRIFLNHYKIDYKKTYGNNKKKGCDITKEHIEKCIEKMESKKWVTIESRRFMKGLIC